MRARVDMLENRATEVASDGKKTVDAVQTQEANISIIHDVVNTLGQSIMNFVSNLEVLKAHCDNLDALVVDMPELEKIQKTLNDVKRNINKHIHHGSKQFHGT